MAAGQREFCITSGIAFGDGQRPEAGLVFDAAGDLYGTTSSDGAGAGTVFELTPQANGKWTQKILDQFQNLADAAFPWGGLIFDAAGNLYGTTLQGGSGVCSLGCGTVFELTPNSRGGWTEIVLHNFGSGTDGIHPYDRLVFDAA